MMRILLINGAHRRDGFTKILVDLFSEGCIDSGASVDRVDLLDHKIKTESDVKLRDLV